MCKHADVSASFGTRFVYGKCVQNDNCDKEFIKHFGSIYAGVKTFMIVTHTHTHTHTHTTNEMHKFTVPFTLTLLFLL